MPNISTLNFSRILLIAGYICIQREREREDEIVENRKGGGQKRNNGKEK